MKTRLSTSTLNLLAAYQAGLDALIAGLRFASPLRRIQTDRQRLDDFARRGRSALKHRLTLNRSSLKGFERRLESLNPLAVLARGYAVVTLRENGKLVSQVKQTNVGDEIQVRVSDGTFDATVSKDKEP
jgi:exodeoxyribonuclease VII large subunit